MFGNLKNKTFILNFLVIIKFIFVLSVSPMEIESSNKHRLIVNFVESMNAFEWLVVNDSVMGGVSRSRVSINPDGYM